MQVPIVGPIFYLVMSTENLDRGTGPLRLGAGRVWAHVLISRNVAGLAGKGLCGMGFMRDGPIEPAVTLKSRNIFSSHFVSHL